MRYKAIKWFIILPIIAIAIWGGTQLKTMAESEAAAVTPGSVDDPVVTKSYVDERIASIGKSSSNSGSATPVPPSPGSGSATSPAASDNTAKGGIEVVTVPNGQTLVLEEGAEAIVRVGAAVAYSPDSNGIPDLTAGIDIKSGEPVENNHLILIPRSGRGITPDPQQKSSLTVIVRGKYVLKATDADTPLNNN